MKLLAGPWLGEFGHELMAWVPHLRYISKKYSETIVICQKGHGFLYEFADKIEEYDKKGLPDRWLHNGKKVKMPVKFITKYPLARIYRPRKGKCLTGKRKYKRLGAKNKTLGYELVIHARACTKYGQNVFNWSVANYSELIRRINPRSVCCIGSLKDSYSVPDADDLRGITLEALVDIMASSIVMVSPSSGPAHLSNLCGLPLVVWTTSKKLKFLGNRNNRWRYETYWRPFKTPVVVVDKYGWQPPVKAIAKEVKKIL